MRLSNSVALLCALIPGTYGVHHAIERNVIADPPTQRGTVTLTIGGANEVRSEYEFGSVSGLTFDAKGQIFVSDQKENNIKAFSSDGKYLFKMGQKGAGPGDLINPMSINFAKDGKLWVRDYGNHRFSVFDAIPPAGKNMRVVPFLTSDVQGDRVHWDAGGHVVEVTHAATTKPGMEFRAMRNFLDDHGAVVTTDTAPPIASDSTENWLFHRKNGTSTYSKPFGARRLAAYGDGGSAAFATNTNYAVRIVDAKGKQITTVKRTVTPVALSTKDEATVTQLLENIAIQNKVTVSSLDFEKPKLKPAIFAMQFDMDGRLWVQRSTAADKPNEADVYDRTGKWIAIMQWPAEISLQLGAIKGNTAVGVAKDEDGLERIMRLSFK